MFQELSRKGHLSVGSCWDTGFAILKDLDFVWERLPFPTRLEMNLEPKMK